MAPGRPSVCEAAMLFRMESFTLGDVAAAPAAATTTAPATIAAAPMSTESPSHGEKESESMSVRRAQVGRRVTALALLCDCLLHILQRNHLFVVLVDGIIPSHVRVKE